MCTLIAIHRQVPGRWLVLAANRDEFLDRPAEGPAIRAAESGPILAPLDVKAGGTWLGLNKWGVVCGLTNLSGSGEDQKRRSRGQVVTDCLSEASAAAAAERLASIPTDLHNAFNCFVCDPERAFVAAYKGTAKVEELAPGVHIVGNADATAPPVPKVDRLLGEVRSLASGPSEDLLDQLGGLCREHGTANQALDETCVHVADTYGTRSSILLELGADFGRSDPEAESGNRLFYSDGPPCATPYKDLSPLLQEFEQMPTSHAVEFLTRNAS